MQPSDAELSAEDRETINSIQLYNQPISVDRILEEQSKSMDEYALIRCGFGIVKGQACRLFFDITDITSLVKESWQSELLKSADRNLIMLRMALLIVELSQLEAARKESHPLAKVIDVCVKSFRFVCFTIIFSTCKMIL